MADLPWCETTVKMRNQLHYTCSDVISKKVGTELACACFYRSY